MSFLRLITHHRYNSIDGVNYVMTGNFVGSGLHGAAAMTFVLGIVLSVTLESVSERNPERQP